MDSVKIEMIGNGVELVVGELTNLQTNYIVSHQMECGKIIPLINDSFIVNYTNWTDLNDVCSLFGANYKHGSEIKLTVNGVTTLINEFNEERRIVNTSNDKNYMMSIKHIFGDILTYEFSVENFDLNKLKFLVDDLNSLLWGELIYGVKYDGVIQNGVLSVTTENDFENIIVKNDMVLPIQKI